MDVLVRFLNALLMIALPLALAAFLVKRTGVAWAAFGIGAASFVISQFFHLPFNQFILRPWTSAAGLSQSSQGLPRLWLITLYGLSAGVFEETTRLVIFRIWQRNRLTWRQALMFGTGHGGLEAILLGVLALYGLFQAMALRQVDLSTVVSPDLVPRAQAQLDTYWSASSSLALLGAVERAGALLLHLCLSLLVLRSIQSRQWAWFLTAIGWHALANTLAVVVLQTRGPYLAEGVVMLFGLASLAMILALRPPPEAPVAGTIASQASPLRDLSRRPIQPTEEDLEDSRFVG